MKTSTTMNIGVQKKQPRTIQIHSMNFPRVLAVAILISVCVVLFYNNLYVWSIGALLVSFAAIKIYNVYRSFHDFDWSIDISDLTMEEVIDDLENR